MTVGPGRSVLLVDDHLSFSEALALAVDETGDLHCVGTVSSLAEAMAALDRLDPDVVVLDLGLPDAQGASAVAQLLHGRRDRRILVLTGRLELELLRQALDAGAAGFLHKDSPIAVVLDAMRSLPRHCVVVRPSMLLALLQRHTGQPLPASAGILSRRELEVLGLLADGLTPKAIASQLGISITTCRGYIKNVLSRMGAHSQLEAVSMARREGLL